MDRDQLRAFGAAYDYDVSYMEALADASPEAFRKFGALFEAANHREVAPIDSVFAAKIIGGVAEDCGPCTQLVVKMAAQSGMASDQIEAVLTRNVAAMNAETALGFRFADAIVSRTADEDDAREAVRAKWGDKGVIDLTFGAQLGRLYPMVKAGLGFAKECRRVTVGDKPVDVEHRAA